MSKKAQLEMFNDEPASYDSRMTDFPEMLRHVLGVYDKFMQVGQRGFTLHPEFYQFHGKLKGMSIVLKPHGNEALRPEFDPNFVMSVSFSAISTCKCSLLQSGRLKTAALQRDSMHTSIIGSG